MFDDLFIEFLDFYFCLEAIQTSMFPQFFAGAQQLIFLGDPVIPKTAQRNFRILPNVNGTHMGMGQNPVRLVNIKIAGK